MFLLIVVERKDDVEGIRGFFSIRSRIIELNSRRKEDLNTSPRQERTTTQDFVVYSFRYGWQLSGPLTQLLTVEDSWTVSRDWWTRSVIVRPAVPAHEILTIWYFLLIV